MDADPTIIAEELIAELDEAIRRQVEFIKASLTPDEFEQFKALRERDDKFGEDGRLDS